MLGFNVPGDVNFTFTGYADGTVSGGASNVLTIVDATYGGNCGGVTTGNDTARLVTACGGHQSPCVFPASGGIFANFGSDPANGCPKTFTAHWKCNGGATQSLTVCNISPDALGVNQCEAGFTNATLTCP